MAITASFASSLSSVIMAPSVSAATLFAQVDAFTCEEMEHALAAGDKRKAPSSDSRPRPVVTPKKKAQKRTVEKSVARKRN